MRMVIGCVGCGLHEAERAKCSFVEGAIRPHGKQDARSDIQACLVDQMQGLLRV